MDFNLMKQALDGDKNAVKMYCGSYTLVRNKITLRLFRFRGDDSDIPHEFEKVPDDGTFRGMVYDKDGFLHSRYWILPRL